MHTLTVDKLTITLLDVAPERLVLYPAIRPNVRFTTCEILEDLVFRCHGVYIVAHAGSISDGASIPRGAQWAIPKWGPHTWGALCHDVLYGLARAHAAVCSRAEADEYLHRRARDDGMHAHTAWIMWAAVRAGGASNWYPPTTD